MCARINCQGHTLLGLCEKVILLLLATLMKMEQGLVESDLNPNVRVAMSRLSEYVLLGELESNLLK